VRHAHVRRQPRGAGDLAGLGRHVAEHVQKARRGTQVRAGESGRFVPHCPPFWT
jgi:hypothetical protein